MASLCVLRAFRARNDDGDEATATWRGAQNANVTIAAGSIFRVRWAVQQTSGSNSNIFQATYNKNAAGANNVGAASSVVRSHASAFVADGVATTAQLPATNIGNYIAGAVDTVDGMFPAIVQSSVSPQWTEVEACMELRAADVVAGDTIVLTIAGVNSSDFTLTITVSAAVAVSPLASSLDIGGPNRLGIGI